MLAVVLTETLHWWSGASCLFTRLDNLAWSQQGFWQPSFCRKQNLWSLCCYGRTEGVFLCIDCMASRKSEEKFLLPNFKPLYTFSLLQEINKEKSLPYFPDQSKGFINHNFCRNWAVRDPTGTRLDSSLVYKQVGLEYRVQHSCYLATGSRMQQMQQMQFEFVYFGTCQALYRPILS